MYEGTDDAAGMSASAWRTPLAKRGRQSRSGKAVDGLSVTESVPSSSRALCGCVACAACDSSAPHPAAAAVGFASAHFFASSSSSSAAVAEVSALPLPRRAFCCDVAAGPPSSLWMFGADRGSVLAATSAAIVADLRPPQPAVGPVRCVAACPYDASAFATVADDAFHVWAVEGSSVRDARPVLSRRLSAQLSRFAWSPHSEAIAAVGAAPHLLAFVDIRLDKPVVARKEDAHAKRVSALAWSPYVPYWLATGGTDACVNVWDLRNAARPVLRLEHHTGAINSIAWDTRHAEILAIGSSDAVLSCCSLELRPEHVLWSHSARSALSAVGFASTRTSQSCCFGVTDVGSVVVATMDSGFFLPVIAERKVFADEGSRGVAQQVYLRQFKQAFSGAYALALDLEAKKKPEEALAVLSLCFQREVQTAVDFSRLDAQAPSEEIFSQDVAGIAIQVPPGFHSRFGTEIERELSVDIEQLKIVLELQIHLQKKQFNAVVARHKDICDAIRKERSRVDVALLFRVLRACLETDYLATIGEFGVDYALLFAASRNFPAFAPLAHLLFFPTIFDGEIACVSSALAAVAPPGGETDAAPAGPASVVGEQKPASALKSSLGSSGDAQKKFRLPVLLKSHEFVIEQLRFLHAFIETSWKTGPDTVQRLRELMSPEKRPRPFVLPFAVNATFLFALLREGFFGEFFEYASELVQITVGHNTQPIFEAFSSFGVKDFERFLGERMSPSSKRPWETDHLQKALNAIIFLSKNPSLAPGLTVAGQFGHKLSKIASALERALHGLRKNPDPSVQLSGREQCRFLAEAIRKQVAAAKSELPAKPLQEGFDAILASLERFA